MLTPDDEQRILHEREFDYYIDSSQSSPLKLFENESLDEAAPNGEGDVIDLILQEDDDRLISQFNGEDIELIIGSLVNSPDFPDLTGNGAMLDCMGDDSFLPADPCFFGRTSTDCKKTLNRIIGHHDEQPNADSTTEYENTELQRREGPYSTEITSASSTEQESTNGSIPMRLSEPGNSSLFYFCPVTYHPYPSSF